MVSYLTEAIVLFTYTIFGKIPDKLKNNLDRIKIDTILNLVSVLISKKEKVLAKQLNTSICKTIFCIPKIILTKLKAIYQSIAGRSKQGDLSWWCYHSVSLLLSKAEAQE